MNKFNIFFPPFLTVTQQNCSTVIRCSTFVNQQQAALSSKFSDLVSPSSLRQAQDYQEWFTYTHIPSLHNNWVTRPHIIWSFCSSASTFTHDTCYNIWGSLLQHPFLRTLVLPSPCSLHNWPLSHLTPPPPPPKKSPVQFLLHLFAHFAPPSPSPWKAFVAPSSLFVYCMCAFAHVCVWLHSLYWWCLCRHTNTRQIVKGNLWPLLRQFILAH